MVSNTVVFFEKVFILEIVVSEVQLFILGQATMQMKIKIIICIIGNFFFWRTEAAKIISKLNYGITAVVSLNEVMF